MQWHKSDLGADEGISCWWLDDPVPTSFPYQEIDVNLISNDPDRSDDISQFDLPCVDKILENLDEYFAMAIDHIKEAIREAPDQFQLTDDEMAGLQAQATESLLRLGYKLPDNDVTQYLDVPPREFPVWMPNIVFYPDKTWMIRFVESSLPTVNYGHGLGVFFDQDDQITGMEIFPEED